MNTNIDYYKVLGLTNQAEIQEIKKTYKKQAIKLHPDKTKGDKAKEQLFKETTEAYSTLSNPQKKSEYDQRSQFGKSFVGGNPFGGFQGGNPFGQGGFNPFNAFKDMFGGHGGNPFGHQQQQEFRENLDIQVNMVVSLRDVYSDAPITVKYNKNIHCPDCGGTGFDRTKHSDSCEMCDGKGKDNYGRQCEYCQGIGKIYSETCQKCNGEKVVLAPENFDVNNIRNIRKNTQQYLKNYGHQSKYYRNKKGVLILNAIYEHVKNYEIKNLDLYYNLDLHYLDAIDGKKIEYEHLDNKKINVSIPKKTKDGDIIRIKEKGLLNQVKKRGDLYFKINIIVDYDKI